MGISTILNSEVAAIKRVLELLDDIAEGDLYFDKDFGPKTVGDVECEEDDDGNALDYDIYTLGKKP